MPDAEISASTAPEKVVKTRSDGSFTLQVKEHTGTFTLTVKKAGYASVTISIGAEKSNQTVPVIQLTKVYTTTVRGKVITPAKAADSTKGSIITTARVWSSIDPAKKVDVGTDGSYSLQVVNHTGSFDITAEYTAAGNRNYKTSDPRTVTTRGAAIENQDIALNYGYTTRVTGAVVTITGEVSNPVVGATVVIEVEGMEAGRDTTEAGNGAYRIANVNHPGVMTAKVTSSTGNDTRNLTTTDTELIRIFNL